MERCAHRGTQQDPFLLTTAKPLDCKLLEDASLAFGDPKRKFSQKEPDRLAYTKRVSAASRTLKRLLMAILGSLTIIAPFLVMVLVSGQLVRLICMCAFAMAFAAAITVGSSLSADRIALATAAYAAALAIFVGTNLPTFQY